MPAFVPHIYSAQVLVYNPDTVKEPPQSMGDLLAPNGRAKSGVSTASHGSWQAASLHESAPRPTSTRPRPHVEAQRQTAAAVPETDTLAPAFSRAKSRSA